MILKKVQEATTLSEFTTVYCTWGNMCCLLMSKIKEAIGKNETLVLFIEPNNREIADRVRA